MTNCRFADRVEPVRPKADQHPGMVGQHGRNLHNGILQAHFMLLAKHFILGKFFL